MFLTIWNKINTNIGVGIKNPNTNQLLNTMDAIVAFLKIENRKQEKL
jgi:hypothetical protein